MKVPRLAAAAVTLALPFAAVLAPTGASARPRAHHHAVAHHRSVHRRGHRNARTVTFSARVVRASAKGLVVRRTNGRILSFSTRQLAHRAVPNLHHRHGVKLSVSAGTVVVNILGLQ